jgi:hypothetical protein
MSVALKVAFEKALAEMRAQHADRVDMAKGETLYEKGRRMQLAEDIARVEAVAKILEAP